MNAQEEFSLACQGWQTYSQELLALQHNLDADVWQQLLTLVTGCKGKIAVTGVGTSGIAARKIAHMLACVEQPAVWLLVYLTNGTWLYGFPDWFMNGINWFSFTAADGYDYGLTLPLLSLLGVIIATGVLMNRTRVGRQIYAMGSNRDAASRLLRYNRRI